MMKMYLYLAFCHDVEVHPLRIKGQIGRDAAVFVYRHVAVFESPAAAATATSAASGATVAFHVLHHHLIVSRNKKNKN